MSARDPLATGLGALACGTGLGGGCITLMVTVVRATQRVDLSRYDRVVPDVSLDLVAGMVAGIGLAAGFGWRRSRALDNDWQRGVIAVLAAFGAVIVAFLAWPFWQFFQVPGLLVWAAASIALGIAGSAWAVRGSRESEAGSDQT